MVKLMGHGYKLAAERCEDRWQLRDRKKQERINDWEILKRVKLFSSEYYRKELEGLDDEIGEVGV